MLRLRAVEIAAHDAHTHAVAPIEFAGLLIENDLLGRVGLALCDDRLAVPSVEIRALNQAVVKVWDAHVGPVDVTGFHIDDDPVGQMAFRHNGFASGGGRQACEGIVELYEGLWRTVSALRLQKSS